MQVFLALSKRILSLILLDLESKLSLLYTYFGGPYGSVPVDKKGIFSVSLDPRLLLRFAFCFFFFFFSTRVSDFQGTSEQ